MSKESIVKEIHKQARKNFPRRHVVMKDIDDLWQADLIDMQSVSKVNSGYKYILVIIDTFSKYGWAYPLKQKSGSHVAQVFQDLFKNGRFPKNLQTDLGTEFYNKQLGKIFKFFNINHYSTYSVKKASIAERFIRTIKSKMYKQFSLQGNYNWTNILSKLLTQYNDTIHRTIGLKPNQVNAENKSLVLKRYCKMSSKPILAKQRIKFKVGDFVRISKYKGTFEKGYTPNWSTEIFSIKKVQNTIPITYLIEDAKHRPILGSFYPEELQKTEYPNIYLVERVMKKKGDNFFVKWLGLPSEENCWINKSEVL